MNLTMVDADTKLHPALGRETRVPHLKCALELDSTLDGIDDNGKLGEDAVAGEFTERDVVLLDQVVDDLTVRR